jgi:hypothetical protein
MKTNRNKTWYTKYSLIDYTLNEKQRIIIERQEYPRKTVTDLIDERLGANIHGL